MPPEQMAMGAATASQMRDASEFYRRGRLPEAERVCRAILAREPDHFEARRLLGVTLYWSGEFEAAQHELAQALTIDPASVDTYLDRGQALRSLSRYEESLACAEQAVALRPDFAQALYSRGVALMDLQRSEEALAGFDAVLAIDPNHAEAINDRGITLGGMNRLDEAIAHYDRAIAINPNYAHALNNRGVALCAAGRFEEALANFARLLAIAPNYAEGHYNRGITLSTLKHANDERAASDENVAPKNARLLADALASYDEAIALRPSLADAYNRRGAILFELGRIAEALQSYDRALALQPDFPEAAEGRARCAALGYGPELGRELSLRL